MSASERDTSHRARFVHSGSGPVIKFETEEPAADPTPVNSLLPLIEQCRVALTAELYYVALVVALTLPDICSALASYDGRATRTLYKAWLHEQSKFFKADAALMYGLRCSLLHQGSAFAHGGDLRVVLVEPGGSSLDFVVMEVAGEQAFVIDLAALVVRLCDDAEAWLKANAQDPTVLKNIARTVHRRPGGLLPFFEGLPVFA
jgi:hypothetical protein